MACEYTKGPWKHTTEDGDSHIHSADGESLMCDTQYYPWCPKNEADWHLIAAAPELLEGCKDALRVLEAMGHKDTVYAIDLRTLISKAEGK